MKYALQDLAQVQVVEVVIAVMFFIRYESLVSSEQFIETSKRHMRGAIALLRLRGEDCFRDEDFVAVFRGVRTQMLIEALQAREALESFPGGKGWMGDFAGDDLSPEALITGYEVEMTSILHRAQQVLSMPPSSQAIADEVSILLQQTTSMEQRLDHWATLIPESWYAKTAIVATDPLPEGGLEDLEVWPGPLHAYPSAQVSMARNHARALQILCGDVVNGARAWLNPAGCFQYLQYRLTRNKVQALVDEICYSVPFHQWGHDLVDCLRPNGQDKTGVSPSSERFDMA